MILEAKEISKTFAIYKRKSLFKRERKEFQALKNFSLSIKNPIIYGLIGPNGAGKTTFIKHCLGLVEKTSGSISVLGFDPYTKKKEFLKQIGFVSGQKQNLDHNLAAMDSLKYSGYMYDMMEPEISKKIYHLAEIFEVTNKLDVPVRQLSLGQRMKFEIISSVLHQPKFLFMDEPTIGLDFDAQRAMHSLLKKLHQEYNLTILLTSHYLPDITTLCERVAVIDQGEKVFDGELNELTQITQKDGYLKTLTEELQKEQQWG